MMVENTKISDVIVQASSAATDPSKVRREPVRFWARGIGVEGLGCKLQRAGGFV